MADISKIKLPDGTVLNIKDLRLPVVSSSDINKVVTVDSSGNYMVATPSIEGTEAYVSSSVLYIITGINNGDEVSY